MLSWNVLLTKKIYLVMMQLAAQMMACLRCINMNLISTASRLMMKSLGENLILIVARSELLMFYLSQDLMMRRNPLCELN